MSLEKWLDEIIKNRGINLSEMSRLIGVPYMALYSSLRDKSREGIKRVGINKSLQVP